jgi:hypothetical protein
MFTNKGGMKYKLRTNSDYWHYHPYHILYYNSVRRMISAKISITGL